MRDFEVAIRRTLPLIDDDNANEDTCRVVDGAQSAKLN
jgi:hypothetical protein